MLVWTALHARKGHCRWTAPSSPWPTPPPLQEGGDVLVRVLSLPEGCSPGDAIHLEGGAPGTDFPKECKS